MRIDSKEHFTHRWASQELLHEFKVEDVWQLPVVLQPEHTLEQVHLAFAHASNSIENSGFTGMLFRLRLFIGRIFNWDQKISQTGLIPGSIRERYSEAMAVQYDQLPAPGDGAFTPVYHLDQESLSEIENATVHAAIHLGRVPLDEKQFTVQMTIYVKAKGAFGRSYMKFIRPFRWLIVYPTLMKVIGKSWQESLLRN
jgi:hypothetical protein